MREKNQRMLKDISLAWKGTADELPGEGG